MVKAFVKDVQRLIEVTPTQDCVDELIRASVYLHGKFIKEVNQVLVDRQQSRAVVEVVNSGDEAINVTVTVRGKNINEENFVTVVHEETVSVAVGSQTISFSFDDSLFRDLKVSCGPQADIVVEAISVSKVDRDFDPEGVVVGGVSGEKIVIPCDFRGMDASDDYSIVFSAENVGVIARDRLLLFDKDGYGTGDEE